MKRFDSKIEAVRNMLKGLHKDLRVDMGHNVHLEQAISAILDEILILEQRIGQVKKNA